MERGAWWVTVHRGANSWIRLTKHTGTHSLCLWAVAGRWQRKQTYFVIVQLLSCVRLFVTSWTAARTAAWTSWTADPCPSLSSRVCSNSCALSQWCHPTILSSVTPFSSCPQFSPASGSFPVSWLFISGSQSIGASASASVLPMNIQDWFSLELSGLISLQFKGPSRVFSSTTIQKHQFLASNSLIHTWLLEKL